MGNILGSYGARNVGLDMNDKPTFDEHTGFSFERKPRGNVLDEKIIIFTKSRASFKPVMVAKEEDLISARIPPEKRDYCSHYLLEYQVCRFKKMPLVYKCAHEKHDYLNCEQQDYVLRMKEFERERRLRLREKRLAAAA